MPETCARRRGTLIRVLRGKRHALQVGQDVNGSINEGKQMDIDDRHGAPRFRWPHGTVPDFARVSGLSRHDIDPGPSEQLPLQALLLRRPTSDKLVVSLHGALDRRKYELPRFERLTSLRESGHNLLFLSDSTLLLEPRLRLAWFIGTTSDNLADRYARLIRAVADQLGLRQIVLVGASSGGFAALALAPRLPDALAVAFSPQTNVGRYNTNWSRELVAAAFPDVGSYEEVEHRMKERVDLGALYSSTSGGRAWYVQNSGDLTHVEMQMNPFREVVDDRVTFVVEFHCEGHNPPTTTRTRAWVDFACQNFHETPGSGLAAEA